MKTLILSETESDRFKRRVYRAETHTATLDSRLIQSIKSLEDAIIIVRSPAGAGTQGQLTALGIASTYADTLIYYHLEPGSLSLNAPSDCGGITNITSSDAQEVAEIASTAFSGYRSHYAASPQLFPSKEVDAGYAQWANNLSQATGAFGNNYNLISRDDNGRPLGFIACTSHSDGSVEIILNAVTTLAQGAGVYASLLERIVYAASIEGKRLIVSTQVTNFRVQRAWIKQGFLPFQAMETLHVVC